MIRIFLQNTSQEEPYLNVAISEGNQSFETKLTIEGVIKGGVFIIKNL